MYYKIPTVLFWTIIIVIAVLCLGLLIVGCNSQDSEKGHGELANPSETNDSSTIRKVSPAQLAFDAMKRGETPLFSQVSLEGYHWEKGPVCKLQVSSLSTIYVQLVEDWLERLRGQLPPYDPFISKHDNYKRYDSIVIGWEADFFHALDSLEIPYVYTLSSGEYNRDKIITESRAAPVQSYAALYQGYYGSYWFDRKVVYFHIPGGPLIDALRSAFRDPIERSKPIPCTPQIAKEILDNDSATVAILISSSEPKVTYERKHEIDQPRVDLAYFVTTDNWEIDIGLRTEVRRFDFAGIKSSNGGSDTSKVLSFDYGQYMKKTYGKKVSDEYSHQLWRASSVIQFKADKR